MYAKLVLSTAFLIGSISLWILGFSIWAILSWAVAIFLIVGESDGGGYV